MQPFDQGQLPPYIHIQAIQLLTRFHGLGGDGSQTIPLTEKRRVKLETRHCMLQKDVRFEIGSGGVDQVDESSDLVVGDTYD